MAKLVKVESIILSKILNGMLPGNALSNNPKYFTKMGVIAAL